MSGGPRRAVRCIARSSIEPVRPLRPAIDRHLADASAPVDCQPGVKVRGDRRIEIIDEGRGTEPDLRPGMGGELSPQGTEGRILSAQFPQPGAGLLPDARPALDERGSNGRTHRLLAGPILEEIVDRVDQGRDQDPLRWVADRPSRALLLVITSEREQGRTPGPPHARIQRPQGASPLDRIVRIDSLSNPRISGRSPRRSDRRPISYLRRGRWIAILNRTARSGEARRPPRREDEPPGEAEGGGSVGACHRTPCSV